MKTSLDSCLAQKYADPVSLGLQSAVTCLGDSQTPDVSVLLPVGRRPPIMPTVQMPAMPPILIIEDVRRFCAAWRARAWIRRALRQSDDSFTAVGYSRDELIWANGLPTRVDATEALRLERCGVDTKSLIRTHQ